MQDALIVGALRTPVGKHGGVLRDVRPDDLAAHIIRALVDRSRIAPKLVDDIYWGAANQAGEDNRNVARMAGLLADLPVSVPGVTLNRLCGSGLQAVVSAAREIQVGAADIVIAGGVESMTRAPYVLPKPDTAFKRGDQIMFDTTLGWRMVNPKLSTMYPPISLGETAENVAEKYGISRQEQDEFALRSHERAIRAHETGRFADEIVPIDVPTHKSNTDIVSLDEGPRSDTSLEKLARLKPAFKAGGSVTAGNSSQVSDGACAILIMSRAAAAQAELEPIAKFVDASSAGVDPAYMGIGPVLSTRKLLCRLGMKASQLDVVELNEAFASQAVACVREIGIAGVPVNPNGGAIAIGHPLGASGARLVTTLVHEMRREGMRYGMASMCIGVGQGISAIFERAGA